MEEKYEYQEFWYTLNSKEPVPVANTLSALSKLGNEGWEVCAKLYQKDITSILLLKREIKPSSTDIK